MKVMKRERPDQDHEPVRTLLREWQITASLPPRFAENVWRRIEKAEPALLSATNPTPWTVLKTWMTAKLRRPVFAYSYVSLLLVTGLLAGYRHARVERAAGERALASRYVQAVDPFQKSARN